MQNQLLNTQTIGWWECEALQGARGKKGSAFIDGCYCLELAQQTENSEWEVPAQCGSVLQEQ